MTATGDADDAQLKERVTEAVTAALAAITPTPDITVVLEDEQEEIANV